MAQAKITMAGTKADNTAFGPTAGSQLDAKINSVVNLDNLNAGGELTFTWSILDQPPGAADSLSSVSAQNPFFTPKKEGSYLLRLIVNQSLPTEQEDRVVLAVAQLKTRERMPAAGETNESDTSDGWAVSMNSLLRRVDTLLSDPGIIVGVNGSGGTLNRGQVVRAPATDIIKGTLPGQETVPSFTTVTAATLSTIDELLCIVEGTPSGLPGVPGVGSAENRLMKVRYIGRIGALPIAGPAPTAGDVLFVNDAGAVSSVQGTIRRRIGSSMTTGSPADVWFNGVGGADIDLTPIDRTYLVYGPKGTLPNAFRVDGVTNGDLAVVGGNSFTIKTGDASTITQVLRRFSGSGLAIQQWQTEGGTVLAEVQNNGQLTLNQGLAITSGGASITSGGLLVQAGGITVDGGTLAMSASAGGITFGTATQTIQWSTLYNISARIAGVSFGRAAVDYAELFTDAGNTFTHLLLATTAHAALLRLSGTELRLLSSTSVPLDLGANNTTYWRVATTGQLQAVGADRAIQNVLDPVNPQDAATKVYAETVAWEHNGAHNGNFAIWQRGTSGTVTQNAAGYGTSRGLYRADRWFVAIRQDGAPGGIISGSNTASYTRVSTGAVAGVSEFAASVAVTGRRTGIPSADGFTFLCHDFDRDFVKRARGKKVTISFKWRKAAGFDASHVVVDFITSTGNVYRNLTNYTGTNTNLMGIFTPAASVPSSWGTTHATFVTNAVIPTNATCMSVAIGRAWGNSTAFGATNALEITDVVALIGDFASLTSFPQYPLAGGSAAGSMDICQRFYETSAFQSGPAPTQANAQQDFSVMHWAQFDRYAVFKFKTRKWAAPIFYDFTGEAQGFNVWSNVFPGPVWTSGTITELLVAANGTAINAGFSGVSETEVFFSVQSPGSPFNQAAAMIGCWAVDVDFG